jgi:hypothetical protein
MHTRRAPYVSARRLNCGVSRNMDVVAKFDDLQLAFEYVSAG